MDNATVANLLRQYADLADIKGENSFRVSAFRRAADAVEGLAAPIADLASSTQLTDVPGIGAGIAAAISEIVEQGHFAALDALLDEVPGTLLTLLDVPGVGPKTAGRLYRELNITDLVQLEAAARSGQIRTLKGYGARQEERILQGIGFLSRRTNRTSIGLGLPLVEAIAAGLAAALDTTASPAGSARRFAETVGNLDLVVAATDLDRVLAVLTGMAGLSEVRTAEPGIITAVCDQGIDLRVVVAAPERFGTELLRWTGNAAFVERLVERAGGSLPDAPDEAGLFQALGLDWVAPELRERPDAQPIPNLIRVDDLQGDLHLHSEWSDGRSSIEELARAAARRGYQYLSISDHSFSLAIAGGLSVDRLEAQRREIERVNELVPQVRLLRSCEVEVRRDGSLDFPDEVLSQLDIVIASLHSGLRQTRDAMTERMIKVLRNPHVDIIAHPTGRIVERREGADYDWDRVFSEAVVTGTALEINANPARLDLTDNLARRAVQAGVRLAINTDAHDLESLGLMRYGIGVARRAGVTAASVVNSRDLTDLIAWLGR